MEESDTVIYM